MKSHYILLILKCLISFGLYLKQIKIRNFYYINYLICSSTEAFKFIKKNLSFSYLIKIIMK